MTAKKNAKPVKPAAGAAEDHLWLEALAGRSASGLDESSVREAEIVAELLRAKARESRLEKIRSEAVASVAQPALPSDKSSANPVFADALYVQSLRMKTRFLGQDYEQELNERVMHRLLDDGLI